MTPAPTTVYTEKELPIQVRWLFRESIVQAETVITTIILWLVYIWFSAGNPVISGFDHMFIWLIGFILILFLASYISKFLYRAYTHYSLDASQISLRDGILTRNERIVQFSVVQNVIIRQDILDVLFGLATVVIENASLGGGAGMVAARSAIVIPGLSVQHAHFFKSVILAGIKRSVPHGL
jgi:uncharacterized membrane protein YdbT with pleckstrin-like domain